MYHVLLAFQLPKGRDTSAPTMLLCAMLFVIGQEGVVKAWQACEKRYRMYVYENLTVIGKRAKGTRV